jgi:hypothetical protein
MDLAVFFYPDHKSVKPYYVLFLAVTLSKIKKN